MIFTSACFENGERLMVFEMDSWVHTETGTHVTVYIITCDAESIIFDKSWVFFFCIGCKKKGWDLHINWAFYFSHSSPCTLYLICGHVNEFLFVWHNVGVLIQHIWMLIVCLGNGPISWLDLCVSTLVKPAGFVCCLIVNEMICIYVLQITGHNQDMQLL